MEKIFSRNAVINSKFIHFTFIASCLFKTKSAKPKKCFSEQQSCVLWKMMKMSESFIIFKQSGLTPKKQSKINFARGA